MENELAKTVTGLSLKSRSQEDIKMNLGFRANIIIENKSIVRIKIG